MRSEELGELAARVEGLMGPSSEIDCLVWQFVEPDKVVLFDGGDVRTKREPVYGRLADYPLENWGDWEGIARHIGAPRFTADPAVALRLIEQRWPDSLTSYVDFRDGTMEFSADDHFGRGRGPDLPGRLARAAAAALLRLAARSAADA